MRRSDRVQDRPGQPGSALQLFRGGPIPGIRRAPPGDAVPAVVVFSEWGRPGHARAEPIPENEFYEIRDTGRLPDWDYRGPGDVESPFEWKPSDWGWLDGRIVAVDYSTPMLD